jgi:NAD(P)-dependent dehydrogenase (short-subunit alcohol dehydrogenase family)
MTTLPLASRIALITGASRGIGRAAALDLARAGAHVVALARTQGALEFLDDQIKAIGGSATLVPCDLADFDAIDRLGASLFERWGRLDIFIGNAGILGPISPLAHVDPKEWDKVLAINVTANWRLIRSLDLLLRTSDAGRVVFITSGAAHRAAMKPYWGPYAISKAALEAMARTYAAETANTSNIKVMLANPGPLRTRMRALAMPGEDPMTLSPPEEFTKKLLALCTPEWRESARLYDFPTDRLLDFNAPG